MTTQERIEKAKAALSTFKVDSDFNGTDYETAGDALRSAIDMENDAWSEWRDNGKTDVLRRRASDTQELWNKRARSIAQAFPEVLHPDDVVLYFEALMSYSKPVPPELQRVIDNFSKPTFTSKSGRVYGERTVNSMKHYAVAVAVFDDYRDILTDALVELSE